MAIVKVLLVDDVKLFLEFERTFFERTGCQILMATSGPEAIRIAQAERPHIVLLDYEMPGMKGDVVCRTLKEDERTRHIPVLMVTSFGGEEVKEACLAAGATGFVEKPISGKELLERVVDLLQIPYRVFMRMPLSIEITLEGAGVRRRAEGFSEDLSETGILVEVAEYISRDSRVTVELRLPEMDRSVKLEGNVRRTFEKHTPGRFGIGVEFDQVPPTIRKQIRSYVEDATKS